MKNKNKFKLLGITLILVIGIILTGCSKDSDLGNYGDLATLSSESGNSYYSDCEHIFAGWRQTISSGVTEMIATCFRSNCTAERTKSLNDYLKSVRTIRNNVFKNNNILAEINIPVGIISIGSSAFSGCISLKEVTMSDSMISIGSSAFSGCISLKEIVIPANVRLIGGNAFEGCFALSKITFLGSTPPSLGNEDVFAGTHHDFRILVPVGSVDAYRDYDKWNAYASKIHSKECNNIAVDAVPCAECN